MSVNCSVSSIYLDIGQQLVKSFNHSYQYGLYVGIGVPPQNGSLWPSITQNETVWATANSCTPDSLTQCSDIVHDEHIPNISATWRDDTTYQSLDNPAFYAGLTSRYGRDTFNVWTRLSDTQPAKAVSLATFPMTIVANHTSTIIPDFGVEGFLGLGPASTVLDRLYTEKLISSRSYGLFVGTRTGARTFQNGSLDLGGYDTARFTGPVHTYTQSPILANRTFSPFKVRVAQMSLNPTSGRSINLTRDGGFDAYLTTNQYPLRFPRSVTQTIVDNLAARPANNTDNTLRLPRGYEGNMTITLDDGLVVTFDSTWLSDNMNVSPISAAPVQNSSFVSSNSTGFASRPADVASVLGVAFLQQLYLVVSYDTSPTTFSLAQANPGSQYFQQQTFCPGVAPEPASPVSINNFAKQGLIGAVLGGSIGAIALVVLLAFVLKFRLRRWMVADEAQAHVSEIKPRSRWDDWKTYLKVTRRTKSSDIEAKRNSTAPERSRNSRSTQFVTGKFMDFPSITTHVKQLPSMPNSQIPTDQPYSRGLQSLSSNQNFSGTSSVTEIENVETIPPQTKSERLVSLDFGFNHGETHNRPGSSQAGWSLRSYQNQSQVRDNRSGWASSVTRRSSDGESCSKSSIVSSCHSSEDQLWRPASVACSQISQYRPDWRSSSVYSRE